jgi:hypothetical protein
MKRVISFSLWGDKEIYVQGILKNVDMARDMYPDFECWVYVHKESVPEDTISELESRSPYNVRVIYKYGDLAENKSMMWRFEAIDDPEVEVNMSRDCDTVILERERQAVYQWLESDKLFHIMRDHPQHSWRIQGGMFGTRKNPNIPSWGVLMDRVHQTGARLYDQVFLRDVIYPIVHRDSFIHASFHSFPNEITYRFPIEYDEQFNFVGQYIYPDGSQNDVNVEELRQALATTRVGRMSMFF